MAPSNPIYLDHNATTPLLPEVVDAMLPCLREDFGNPSSGHAYGQRARKVLERARAQVASLLGCADDEVVFTSGGTEANNMAIRGVMEAVGRGGRIVTSVIEHPATERPCAWVERQGAAVERLEVDEHGRVRLDEAAQVIAPGTTLVTVMHSNNETGVLQPIEALAQLGRAHGAVVHTDAAQSVGKVPVKVEALGVDLLSLAGHKLYAPKGVGALYVRRHTPLAPFTLGAGHERGFRPGTENVASIVGLGVACAIAEQTLEEAGRRMRGLVEVLWARLAAAIPDLRLNGHPELRLPNTLNVRFPGVSGDGVLASAPKLAASTGSACHDGHARASKVITAMGASDREALGSVRLSIGRHTSADDIEQAARVLIDAWRRCVAQAPQRMP
jgi:cysteine desulfurase